MKFSKQEILTFSNFLSALRMIMVIPLWIILNNAGDYSMRVTAAVICILAAVTDVLDGYFARKFNQVTEFGKIIDPLADKIIVGAVIIKLFLIGDIPDYYFYMIIGRDLLILAGGLIVTKMIGKVLPSNVLGKITVIIISLIILFILFGMGRETLVFRLFYYTSILLIVVSLAAYTFRGAEFIRKNRNGSVR